MNEPIDQGAVALFGIVLVSIGGLVDWLAGTIGYFAKRKISGSTRQEHATYRAYPVDAYTHHI